ncbi:MAG TPA: DNA translocase FtsK [Acidobacteriota bacterium]|nr:DNA translocase FtsK [Acidobacteriota bacterium]HPB26681.1 DNA translocase FtsK [Acidobacteriota bacterium]HQO24140.1 DNA translocase FtsK [Acidobacteriota bacterium]HQP72790.1 DNA translocase FtsK [Acidobacteriota bacterium]
MNRSQQKKFRELLGFLLLFLVFLFVLALVTYSPEDASLNVSTTLSQSRNFIGRAGAWISDFCCHLFGYGAVLLVLPVVFLAVRMIRSRDMAGLFIQWLGTVVLMAAVCGLLDLLFSTPVGLANFTPGGILGGTLKHFLVYYLNTGGAALLLGACLLAGLMLLTPRTLGELFGRIGGLFRRQTAAGPEQPGEVDTDTLAPVAETNPFPPAATEPVQRRAEPEPATGAGDTRPAEAATTGGDARAAAAKPGFRIPITPLEFTEEAGPEPDVHTSNRRQIGRFRLPPFSILERADSVAKISETELMEKAQQIIRKYQEFGIEGAIDAIHPGPVVTLFEFKPAPGVKYSKMISLVDDLCLGLRAESIRIDRIPGKSTVGIEVPNSQRQTIHIREVIESKEVQNSRSRLTLALGKRINGDVFITDLMKMPHLLVAGATGSGKSVGLNTMITSILYRATPDEVRFIFIDPKRLELGAYADIPHLLTPIVTDAKLAANTLLWAVHEMEERYKLLAKYSVREIDGFNRLCLENEDLDPLPMIVIVIDELAELLSVASKEVELCLQRLAQMARAVGIHLIIATQRPSVEVVTGVIKANFPSRISFRLLSRHDSKTILDTIGAEHLLGKGDMLFLPPNSAKLIRVHGAFVSEEETKKLVDFLKGQGEPSYTELLTPEADNAEDSDNGNGLGDDPLFDEVARFVVKNRKASTSVLQRRFRIGYGRAARLMDILEEEGIIGQSIGSRPRDVLVPPDYFDSVSETQNPDA